MVPEAITRQDGAKKNDCERNAAVRLLKRLRQEFPDLKIIITEDGLASNGPHIKLLKELGFSFILGAKEGDHASLFAEVQKKFQAGETQESGVTGKDGTLYGYRFVNNIPLNKTHPDLKVNFPGHWIIKPKGKRLLFSWVTDITLNLENVEEIARGGRARRETGNETFNTLKNQGYNPGHNYGHGPEHLATDLGILMMLAFLSGQVQQISCRVFQKALNSVHARTVLWKKLWALFYTLRIPDWKSLWEAIAERDTSDIIKFHILNTT